MATCTFPDVADVDICGLSHSDLPNSRWLSEKSTLRLFETHCRYYLF